MTTLIKHFSYRVTPISEDLKVISPSFAARLAPLGDPMDNPTISQAFSLRANQTSDMGSGARISRSFAAWYGGYELAGTRLPTELYDARIVRHKQ